jgi:hypothetical protein
MHCSCRDGSLRIDLHQQRRWRRLHVRLDRVHACPRAQHGQRSPAPMRPLRHASLLWQPTSSVTSPDLFDNFSSRRRQHRLRQICLCQHAEADPHQLRVHPHVTKLRQINLQHVTGTHLFFSLYFSVSLILFPYLQLSN